MSPSTDEPSPVSPTRAEQLGAAPRPLDLRLMIPALTAWALSAALLGRSTPTLLVAMALGVTAVGLGAALGCRRDTGWCGCGPLLALTGVAVIAVVGSAAGSRSVHLAGPVHDLSEQRAAVQVRGTVLTQPRLVASSTGEQQVMLKLRLDHITARGVSAKISTPTLVFGPRSWLEVPWRAQISARGRLAPPREPEGAGSSGSDVVAVFSPLSEPALERGPPGVLRSADYVRERLRQAVDDLPPDARGLIPGLVIGDTSLTPPDLSEAMLDTGMSHLSAVSGSNVAIVLGAVVLFCRWSGVPRPWRAPLGAFALIGFVVLCRPEPSVLRAGVMGLIGLAGLSAARRSATVPALAAAILVLLCVDPALAQSYGFALSCVATLGLVVFARPWADAIAARLPRRAAVIGDAIAIPLAAQVVCAPIIVLLQGDIAVIAVLANLLAAPMVAFTTISGIAVALTATAWLPLGSAVAWVAALPALWIAGVARGCSRLPFGHVDWPDGAIGAWSLFVVTLVTVLAVPWLRYHLRRRLIVTTSIGMAMVSLLIPLPGAQDWPPERAVVIACDVGQGDAFVVPTTPGAAVLIDVGPEQGGVVDCLRDADISSLDAVVLSHFHIDHVGGLTDVLAEYQVNAAYLTPVMEPRAGAEATHALLRRADVPIRTAQAGDTLVLGSLRAFVVWPQLPFPRGSESIANNSSLVLDLRTRGVRILFTGDIEAAASARVREVLRGERFDVLKVPHHGSADQNRELTHGLGASVALVGVGQDNTFGHPTPNALALLRQSGMRVFRTDLDGDVMVGLTDRGLVVWTRPR